MYKYICKKEDNFIWTYLIDSESDRTLELHRDMVSGQSLKIGDIFIGRIENIARNIGAAFVRISPQQTAYLPLEELKNPVYTKKGTSEHLQQGDELVVQIKREAIKGKLPAVTAKLSLQGAFVSAEYDVNIQKHGVNVCVSKKLDKERREQLRLMGKELLADVSADNISLTFRTKAGDASQEEVRSETVLLTKQLKQLIETAAFKVCYSRLYTAIPKYLERLRHFADDAVEKIVTDDEEVYAQIRAFLEADLPAMKEKLQLYNDPMLNMSLLYSMERRKREALAKTVPLRSGGSLVISPTEALTAIDVNSGKNIVTSARKTKEEAMLKLNLEAAKEIAHQLRLRNLSGIIVIDFVNMEEAESEKALISYFSKLLNEDPVKTVFVDITRLGLVEVTRKKTDRPLWETFREDTDEKNRD